MADKIENTKEVLIYCGTRLSIAAFMRIIAIFIQLQYPSYVASYIIHHYTFTLTETVYLSIQAAIFHAARETVNYINHSQ